MVVAASLTAMAVCRYAPAAVPVEEAEPSIEDMFAEIEAHKKAAGKPAASSKESPGETTRAASRPAAPLPSAPRPAPARPVGSKPRKRSAEVEKEIKRIHRRATQSLAVLKMQRRNWEIVRLYIRLEKFKKAAEALFPMLRSRSLGRVVTTRQAREDRRMSDWGEIELEYAFAVKHLKQEKAVKVMLAEHKKRLDSGIANLNPYARPSLAYLKDIKTRLAFFEAYPEARRRVEELQAALAKEPDGEKLWELAQLCKPGSYKAERALTWFTALWELVTGHPDHPHVASGEASWELYLACLHHQMHEDCITILTMMLERFPDHPQVKAGNCLWKLAESCGNLGRLRGDLRDRAKAAAAYREAIKHYGEFKARFPGDTRSKAHAYEGRVSPARVDVAIKKIGTGLNRLVR